ncbi:Iron transport multicopper oxidase FET3 [Spathaspora sp. JA1]|nr:Iron transport multicopper oxidase FET3 [Spathaspora sp. JA1]
MKLISILLTTFLWALINAETHTWWFETGWVTANPDGVQEREFIGFNGTWPLPTLRIKKGDTVNLHLINGLQENTTLHFHGMFQRGTNQMDGPEMVTQCPISPGSSFLYNFTVTEEAGTYWYHAHSAGQTGDGMRGVFIIEDDDFPYEYDEEIVLTVADLYHKTSADLMPKFLSRFNPTGAEPIPQNFLFNDTMNATWNVEPNKTYFVRILNVGGFVSQYLWMEDHEFTVIEVDGVYVEKATTDMLYITVAQRYGVLITTKNQTAKNFAFMTRVDIDMLDLIPDDLQLNTTNYIVYNESAPLPAPYTVDALEYLDDFNLRPLSNTTLFDDADYTITLDVVMDNLANGVNYAFFNNITYVHAKVPTLMTALSAGELATNAMVYGSNTNAFVLQPNDVVDIVLNNLDTGKHPFHMHGHVFQLIERHEAIDDNDPPVSYNSSNHAEWPEYPMMRDTIYLEPQSYLVLRFKANNPGIWMFHCHLEWHLDQGLAMLLVEDPMGIQNDPSQQLNDNSKRICEEAGVSWQGNAAGNDVNFLDLTGENVQQAQLPTGFTARGIVALVFSCIAGILGITAIAIYGMSDVGDEKKVARDLDVDMEGEDDDSETKFTEGSSSIVGASTR